MKKLKRSGSLITAITLILFSASCVGTSIPQNSGKIAYHSTSNGIYAIDFYIPGGRFFPSNSPKKPGDFKLKPFFYYDIAFTIKDSLFIPYAGGIAMLKNGKTTYFSSPISDIDFKYEVYDDIIVGIPREYPYYIYNNNYPSSPEIHILSPTRNINTIINLDSLPLTTRVLGDHLVFVTYSKIYIITFKENNDYSEIAIPIPFDSSDPFPPVSLDDNNNILAFGWNYGASLIFVNLYGDPATVSTLKLPAQIVAIGGCKGYLAAATFSHLYIVNYETGRYEKTFSLTAKPSSISCVFPTIFAATSLYIYPFSITTGERYPNEYCYQDCKMTHNDDAVFFVGNKRVVTFNIDEKKLIGTSTHSDILGWTLQDNKLYYITSSSVGYFTSGGENEEKEITFSFKKLLQPTPANMGIFLLLTDINNGSFITINSNFSTQKYENLFINKIVGE